MKLIEETTIQVRSIRAHRSSTKTICPNCRLTCDTRSNFCRRCGIDLNEGTSALRAIHPMQATTSDMQAKPKPLVIAMLTCFSLVVVLFIIGTSVFAATHVTNNPPTVRTQSSQSLIKPKGSAWFYSDRKHNDSIALHVSSLPKPANGKVYVLWLINPLRPNQLLSVGPLLPDSHNNVDFRSGPLSVPSIQGQTLSTLFSHVALTVEPAGTKWIRPSSTPVIQDTISSTQPTAMQPRFALYPTCEFCHS